MQLFSIFSLARAVAPTPRLPATWGGFDSDLHQPPKYAPSELRVGATGAECDAF